MKTIKLRTLSVERDMDFLYKNIMSSDQYLFSTKITCNTIHSFKNWLLNQLNLEFNDFYIVEYMNQKIGYVHDYDFSLKDGRCKLVVCIEEKYREFGIGAIAAILFMKKLFDDYPIRKIYLDIYDYNKESLGSNLKAEFKEEGCIKNYRYHNGKFYDLHILSMDRKTFEKELGGRI